MLHGLRLKGFADTPDLGATSGLDQSTVDTTLTALAGDGAVLHREGRISGWALTPAGREQHAAQVALEVKESGARDGVEKAYRRFLEVNNELLSVCTDWQIRTVNGQQTPNDHSDSSYDAAVIERLAAIDSGIQPVCADLAALLERFRRYGPRLAVALDKVRGGEVEWFTKPMIDSYHTVWFELHEDLLVTLGIERHKEGES